MLMIDDEVIGILIIDCYLWHKKVTYKQTTILSFKFNLSISKFKLYFLRCGITVTDI